MRYSILNKIERITDKIEKVFYNFMNLKIIDVKKINNKYYLKKINNNAKNVLKINNEEFEIFTDFVRNQYHHNNCISLEEIYNFALESNRDFYTKYDQDIIDWLNKLIYVYFLTEVYIFFILLLKKTIR